MFQNCLNTEFPFWFSRATFMLTRLKKNFGNVLDRCYFLIMERSSPFFHVLVIKRLSAILEGMPGFCLCSQRFSLGMSRSYMYTIYAFYTIVWSKLN